MARGKHEKEDEDTKAQASRLSIRFTDEDRAEVEEVMQLFRGAPMSYVVREALHLGLAILRKDPSKARPLRR